VKKTFTLLFPALVIFVASGLLAHAKGLGGPICGMLMYHPVEVVVRAHAAPGSEPAIVVDQSYYGPYKTGDRVQVIPAAFEKEILVPGRVSQPEMFLVLSHFDGDYKANEGWAELFSKDLKIESSLSRRLSDGYIYYWFGTTNSTTYRFWRYITNTAPLTRDETHSDLGALEADLAEGLSRHDEWSQAKAATDPIVKLGLLRQFLLPGGKHRFTAYDVWSCTSEALEEVEKAGPSSIPFLNELLTEPSYQNDYAPGAWLGFGAQERAAVTKSLALVEARAAVNPRDKLAILRSVFAVPQYDFRAGFDPVGMVRQYLDRALAVATSVDEVYARPFLQDLLALPQFQEGFSPIGQTSWGHEFREKIQAALAGLH
jgi:hypothetical protein